MFSAGTISERVKFELTEAKSVALSSIVRNGLRTRLSFTLQYHKVNGCSESETIAGKLISTKTI